MLSDSTWSNFLDTCEATAKTIKSSLSTISNTVDPYMPRGFTLRNTLRPTAVVTSALLCPTLTEKINRFGTYGELAATAEEVYAHAWDIVRGRPFPVEERSGVVKRTVWKTLGISLRDTTTTAAGSVFGKSTAATLESVASLGWNATKGWLDDVPKDPGVESMLRAKVNMFEKRTWPRWPERDATSDASTSQGSDAGPGGIDTDEKEEQPFAHPVYTGDPGDTICWNLRAIAASAGGEDPYDLAGNVRGLVAS